MPVKSHTTLQFYNWTIKMILKKKSLSFTNKTPILQSNKRNNKQHTNLNLPISGNHIWTARESHAVIHNLFLGEIYTSWRRNYNHTSLHGMGKDSSAAPWRMNKLVLSVNLWGPSSVQYYHECTFSVKYVLCLSYGSWGFLLQVRSSCCRCCSGKELEPGSPGQPTGTVSSCTQRGLSPDK